MLKGMMMDYPLTLAPLLERAGKLFGQVEIVSRLPDHSLHRTNYAQMRSRSLALARALVGAGLARGDRVATLMWNHAAHMESYFGVPLAGGVVHTLNLRLHPDALEQIVNHAGDRFLIVDDVLLPLFEQFKSKVRLERVVVVSLAGKLLPAGAESYETFLATARDDIPLPALEEDDAAGMCYTSGTTGQPKGVVYSHRAQVLHALITALTDSFGLSQRDVYLPVVPMFHANAWGAPYMAALVGAKLVLPGPYLDAESLLELFESERVTLAAGVPTIWMALLEALEKNPGRWKLEPHIRVISGGAAAPEAMIRGLDRHGLHVQHSWGMTEMTPAGTTSRVKSTLAHLPEDAQYALRSKQGIPFPLVEARTMTERGEADWDGRTPGELQVRGPCIASGYYKLPEESDRWTSDGWFRTGDVAMIDAEGYIKIADRTKDLVKSGGEWISSVDLENALMGHPAVKEAAVIAVPHPKWQERPLAVVVLKDGAAASPDVLRAHLAAQFAKWQLPDAFVYTDAIPRTSVGKFQKTKLREQFKDWKWT